MEHHHVYMEKTLFLWPFPIVMLLNQPEANSSSSRDFTGRLLDQDLPDLPGRISSIRTRPDAPALRNIPPKIEVSIARKITDVYGPWLPVHAMFDDTGGLVCLNM